ncbi:MAG: hypothetical protein AMJ65_09640 [Phycisphaerae bacterium SG8_4]|nr:MAG: hypothetical protein AMJ65_09640 [Phycisphaerae bacterium SG8_4]
MSDVRRVMLILDGHSVHGENGRWFDMPDGNHALMPWEEYERLREENNHDYEDWGEDTNE